MFLGGACSLGVGLGPKIDKLAGVGLGVCPQSGIVGWFSVCDELKSVFGRLSVCVAWSCSPPCLLYCCLWILGL